MTDKNRGGGLLSSKEKTISRAPKEKGKSLMQREKEKKRKNAWGQRNVG